jgi:alpha-glucosidase
LDPSYLWWRDGIIYQIYPRSFADSNGDGIGDLGGIIARLDYLVHLGIDAIWLSPVNPSPDVDFGYDVSDYLDIDTQYGNLGDFDELVRQAHERGIRVILDLVLNHTSDRHPWFSESRKSRDNPYRDYYLWRDPKPGGGPPNNWLSIFGGPGWELDPETEQMYFHMFYKQQPDLNWRNPAVRSAMLEVLRFWLERGVDGFRLDVFNAYFKDARLANNPVRWMGLRPFDRMEHCRDIDQPEMLPLLREVRELLDAYPERYTVGETFLDTNGMAGCYAGPDKLHGTFDFGLQRSKWRAGDFSQAVLQWEQSLPDDAWPTWVLNNHDLSRTATRYRHGIRAEDDSRLKVAAALLLTLRGTPYLYYGEEIGMRDIHLAHREILDPIGQRYWPFYKGRDGCRAPMQWNGESKAGFTAEDVRPWLPLHPDYKARNVETQEADPNSLFNFYRRLIALRRSSKALLGGMRIPLTYGTNYILAYLRQSPEETVLVALNFSGRGQRLVLGRHLAEQRWEFMLSSRRKQAPTVRDGLMPLLPYEALLLRAAG